MTYMHLRSLSSQFSRAFTILALAGVSYVTANSATSSEGSASLIENVPEEASALAKELLSQGASKRNERFETRHVSARDNHPTVNGDCSQGSVQCCDQIIDNGKHKSKLLGLLGLSDIEGSLGLNCNQVPVIAGAVQNVCKSTPVCCKNVTQNGLINVGCNSLPIN